MRILPQDRDLRLIVSCDGAARGNPGPAGIGVHISDANGRIVAEITKGIGVATNNVAEYTAAIEGLTRAKELGATDVLLRSDSRLMIEQHQRNIGVVIEHGLRFGTIAGNVYLGARRQLWQQLRERFENQRVIVDHENFHEPLR